MIHRLGELTRIDYEILGFILFVGICVTWCVRWLILDERRQ